MTPSPASDDRPPAHRRALSTLTLALMGTWLLMLAPLPWSLAAGAGGIIVAVLVVRAMIALWRAGRRGTAVVTGLMGAPVCAVVITVAVISAVFYGPVHDLQRCERDAITQQSRDTCRERAEQSTAAWVSSLLGS